MRAMFGNGIRIPSWSIIMETDSLLDYITTLSIVSYATCDGFFLLLSSRKALRLTPLADHRPFAIFLRIFPLALSLLNLRSCPFAGDIVATGYPGVEDPIEQRNMINDFLDFAQTQQNVWIVTNQQLLAWMRNPVPVSVSSRRRYSCFYNLV